MGQNQLKNSDILFKTIYEDSPIGIELYDSNGKLIDLNKSCMELFGVSSKDDVKGFDLLNDLNIPTEHLSKLKRRETVNFESVFDFELVKDKNLYRTNKSGKIYLDVLITPLFAGEDKSISNYLVQIRDISDQKIAEHKLIDLNEGLEHRIQERTEQLRKSEADWRVLVEEAPDIIFTVDRNNRILFINNVPEGITREEAIGTKVLDYVSPEYHETVENSIEKVFQTGKSDYYEISARGPDDNPSWYSTRLGAIKQDEEVVSVMLITRDITERKNMEQKLKESEEKFRYIAESSLMGITIVQNNLIKYINQQAAKILGYSVSEMRDWDFKKILKHIYPDDLGLVMENMKKVLMNSPDALNQLEYRVINKSAEILWVANYGSEIQYKGKSAQLITTVDITNKKLAELQLMESEEKYRLLVENAQEGFWAIDENTYTSFVNPKMAEMLGYTVDEMIGKHIFNFIDEKGIKTVKSKLKRRKQGIKEQFELVIYRKDGKKVYTNMATSPLFDNEGIYIGAFALVSDITLRKEAEQELERSEDKYRSFIENFQGIAFQGYQDFTAEFFHGEVENITGYNEDDFVSGRIKWNQIIHPDDINEIIMKANNIHERIDETDKREYRIICKNGKIRWVTEYNQKFYDKVLNKEGVSGVIIDITDKKEAEVKLNDSEKKYRLLTENLNDIITVVNDKGQVEYINEESHLKVMGYSYNDLLLHNVFELIHPEDREKTIQAFEKIFKEGEGFTEARIIKKNGEYIWTETNGKTFIDNDGNLKILTISRDTTKRKRAEQELKESEERFKYLISSSPTIIYTSKVSGDYGATFISDNVREKWGYSSEYFTNNSDFWLNQVHPDDKEGVLSNLSELFEKEHIIYDYRFKLSNGTYRWMRDEVELLKDEEGNPMETIGSVRDINDRKEIEQNLKESEKRSRHIANELEIIIDHLPGIVVYKDTKNNILRVNKFMADAHNLKKEDMEGKSSFEFYPYEDAQAYWEDDLEVVKNRQPRLNIVEPWKTEKGKRMVATSKIPYIDEDDNVKGIIAMAFDITDRIKAEQELKESEMRYRDLFENSPIALFEQDFSKLKCHIDNLRTSGIIDFEKYFDENSKEIENFSFLINFVDANKKAVELYNAETKEDFIERKRQMKKNLFQDANPEVILTNKREIISLINGSTTFESEVATKTFTGEKIYVYMKTLIIPGYENSWSKVIVSLLDITDRIKVEQKLKESEEKFRTIAEQSSLGLIIQQDNLLKFVNRAVSNIIEYPMEEINEWTVEDTFKIIYKDDIPHVKESISEREEDDYETILKYEFRVVTKSGKLKWIEIMSKALKYLGKHAVAIAMIDITAQKEGEEKLKEISKLKSELLSRTSHELKTPLVSIKGYVDLLLQVHYENLDFYTISMLHEIRQGCSRLESLIKDLLETSKLETGAIVLRKERENLSFLIKFCLKELQGLANIRQHKIFVNIEENMITMFEKERIYEVIVNLLSNAIKYTQPKGVIKIGSEVKNNSYIISIEDNGIGLSETDKQKIFKKFGKIERYGKGLDVVSEGTGLGLYISKGIIELHEGEIWVEPNRNGKGSIFYFSLPIVND